MEPWDTWPATGAELARLQEDLARHRQRVLAQAPWHLRTRPLIGGCFVALGPPGGGGQRGGTPQPAWAAAVTWRPPPGGAQGVLRRSERQLRGASAARGPRRALDVVDQVVVRTRVHQSYAPGLLALRHGPALCAALWSLEHSPEVVLVNGTGADHPRRAGLAVHLGAATDLPTVGVTHRPLMARGDFPPLVRGRSTPVAVDGDVVGRWVCTKTGARPVLAHAGWRTDPHTAAAVVLASSTEGARTPVPLQEARRAAREARALTWRGPLSPWG